MQLARPRVLVPGRGGGEAGRRGGQSGSGGRPGVGSRRRALGWRGACCLGSGRVLGSLGLWRERVLDGEPLAAGSAMLGRKGEAGGVGRCSRRCTCAYCRHSPGSGMFLPGFPCRRCRLSRLGQPSGPPLPCPPRAAAHTCSSPCVHPHCFPVLWVADRPADALCRLPAVTFQ